MSEFAEEGWSRVKEAAWSNAKGCKDLTKA